MSSSDKLVGGTKFFPYRQSTITIHHISYTLVQQQSDTMATEIEAEAPHNHFDVRNPAEPQSLPHQLPN